MGGEDAAEPVSVEDQLLALTEKMKGYEDALLEKDLALQKLEAMNGKLVNAIVDQSAERLNGYERPRSDEEIYNDTIDSIAQAIRDKYIKEE